MNLYQLHSFFENFYEIDGKYTFLGSCFDIIPDGTIYLSVMKTNNSKILGMISLEKGLEEYYEEKDYFLKNSFYKPAIENTKDKIGIVQLQKKGKHNHNFRRLLIEKMFELETRLNFNIDFYLSSDLNYWNSDIKRITMEKNHPVPPESVFLMNYDYTARRFGFEYDPETKLFLRK